MTIHVLHAGDGYTYLTRSVAAHDAKLKPGESLTSYYVVTGAAGCTPITPGAPGCGGACGAGTFCSTASACVGLAQTNLCENTKLYVINGQLPPEIVFYDQYRDAEWAASIAQKVGTQCGLTPQTVSQATAGVLDACTDAPLYTNGSTIVLVGGTFGQRHAVLVELARVSENDAGPITDDELSFVGAEVFAMYDHEEADHGLK